MAHATTISAGVLIGGKSRRMGRAKQALSVGGASMLAHIVRVIQPHVDRIILLGDGAPPDDAPPLLRLADAPDAEGPIAGILAALRLTATDTAWLIAACDMPRITPDAVAWLLDQRAEDLAAILPKPAGDRIEPLFAVYEPAARPLIEQIVSAGRFAPHALAEFAEVATPTPPSELAPCWRGVNTPEEFDQLTGNPATR
ncbi:MAG: molybdenum cofactor guanylyltransferase [Phycisphaerae bacterium]